MGVDAKSVDEGSRAIVVGRDDGEAPPAEDPHAKVLGGVDVGVDNEGVGEATCADVLMASCFGMPKVFARPLMPKSLVKAMPMYTPTPRAE